MRLSAENQKPKYGFFPFSRLMAELGQLMKRKIATFIFIILDIAIIIFSFLFIAWFRAGTKRIIVNYSTPLLVFGSIWLVVGLWCQKFTVKEKYSGRTFALHMLKIDLYSLAVVFAVMILFQQVHYSRYLLFGTIALISVLELVIFLGVFYGLKFHKENESFASTSLVTHSAKLEESFSDRYIRDATIRVPQKENGFYSPEFATSSDAGMTDAEWHNLLADNQKLYTFLASKVDLNRFQRDKLRVLNTSEINHFVNGESGSLQMMITLYPINDCRRINQYLIAINDSLVKGGVVICRGETITERRNRFYRKYTPYLGGIIYFFDFIYHRVFPKIPIIQGWYFALTKGRNRAISETEMMGRFYFCGFELISKDEINGFMHFILKKVKPWSNDPNPSYGPFIKLKRVGKDKKIFYLHKLRTMHPYSEYLQDYAYRTCDLQEGGKFANDFRVTVWGKVLRTMWIDELPQILNLLHGEVSLVGVRALSEHYFNLYPPDLQELRCQFKPGLVPPFYADMPKSLEEIIASERRYLAQKQAKPFLTDWKYFWKAVWNIIFKHARSN